MEHTLLTTELLIEDVTCAWCSERLEAALRRINGVVAATVEWPSGRARVRHEESVAIDELVRAVEAAAQGTQHHYRVLQAGRDAGAPTGSRGAQ